MVIHIINVVLDSAITLDLDCSISLASSSFCSSSLACYASSSSEVGCTSMDIGENGKATPHLSLMNGTNVHMVKQLQKILKNLSSCQPLPQSVQNYLCTLCGTTFLSLLSFIIIPCLNSFSL